MCPGGFVIPAATGPQQIVVNGMSPANRGTQWSNSGMVVEIHPEDVEGDSPLRMMDYQERLEHVNSASAVPIPSAVTDRLHFNSSYPERRITMARPLYVTAEESV